jgi:hypothetical protein
VRDFEQLLSRARRALGQEGCATDRPLVVRLVLEGVDGAACALRVAPSARRRAFTRLALAASTPRFWVDDVCLDAGPSLGVWPMLRAA